MRTAIVGGLLAGLVVTGAVARAQDPSKERLEKSPRHLEFVEVKSGDKTLNSFIAYPEVKEKATAVVIVHEIFGLADWIRGLADQYAEAGYIAIAPDLLSGMGPNGGGTAAFASGDAVRQAIVGLPADQVNADLDAVVDYVSKLPGCNGKVVVAGYCWGGARTFTYATHSDKIKAALVFYGTGPEGADAVAKIHAPVYGFYGENDARVNATIPKSEELMKTAGKKYEPVIYAGAGHGFLRAGEAPDASPANAKARADAWERIKAILKGV